MYKLPQTLTIEEAEKLIDELGRHNHTVTSERKAKRNKLLGLLMLKAGLRVGELTQLLVSDLWYLDEPVNSLILSKKITKGKTERTIPLGPLTRSQIGLCKKAIWETNPPTDFAWAFFGANPYKHISPRQVQHIIVSAGKQAISKAVHPHVLRHTFATQLMRITNIRVVQQLLGHKNIQTTQIYTHPNQDDLVKAINGIDNDQTTQETKAL